MGRLILLLLCSALYDMLCSALALDVDMDQIKIFVQ
jgi:hypothetical protein